METQTAQITKTQYVDLRGKVLRHKRYRDICIHVKGNIPMKYRTCLTVDILNLGFRRSWYLLENQIISIYEDQLSEWLVCVEPNKLCLRNAKWKELVKCEDGSQPTST